MKSRDWVEFSFLVPRARVIQRRNMAAQGTVRGKQVFCDVCGVTLPSGKHGCE